MTIIQYGQSPSRILAASIHWYDCDRRNFRKFLSWREKKTGHVDQFKQKLISYADEVTLLECDPIEAALLNALLIIAVGKYYQTVKRERLGFPVLI